MDAVELTRAACFVLFIAFIVVAGALRGKWTAWLGDTRAVFARHGVVLTDSERFRWTARPTEPADIQVDGLVEEAMPPGADPERVGSKASTLLKLALPGGGLLILPPDLVEPLLGPMPPLPRVRTGLARFDTALAMFAQGGALPRWPGGEAFPSPEDLAFLQAHGLRWLRWNDDTLEAAFEPRPPGDAVPLVAFAQALRRRQQGRTVSLPAPGAPDLPVAPPMMATSIQTAAVLLGSGLFVWLGSMFAPRAIGPLNDILSRHLCGVEGLELANEWARCPDGREVTGAALLAGAWFPLLAVLTGLLLWGLSRWRGPQSPPAE